ncbi:hypothetical protein F5Y06DRAFT_109216 [Hypoxylon sp. FL0890]|nr:hypothetical protein F5Y06DRAFT_109216 [Hypoxylon sp. FL0890]
MALLSILQAPVKMTLLRSALFVSWLMPAYGLGGFPTLCTWDPPLTIDTGNFLSARIDNPFGRRCQATLGFTDTDFFPITFDFEPRNCTGFQLAQFTIPQSSPNGDAYVLWKCAGQARESCVHLNISKGLGTLDVSEGVGSSGCVADSRQTITTLVTRTASNSIISQAIPTVVTIPVTMLFPESASSTSQPTSSIETDVSGTIRPSTLSSTPSTATGTIPNPTLPPTFVAGNRTIGISSSVLSTGNPSTAPIIIPLTPNLSPTSVSSTRDDTSTAADARAVPSTMSNTDPAPTNTTRSTSSEATNSGSAPNDSGSDDASGGSIASKAPVAFAAAVTTLTIVTTLGAIPCSDPISA